MQNEIQSLFTMFSPQTIGTVDPLTIFGIYMLAPGVIIFTLVVLGRELFRPRWRGYWDAV
jgi:hypothetical protein